MKSKENKISKNCYKGAQVTSINEVAWCAKHHLSLYNLLHRRIYPAAVVANWQFQYVVDCVENGWLFRVVKDE